MIKDTEDKMKVHTTKRAYEVMFDESAGVWEAYRLKSGVLIWLGAFDTVQEANDACHKDEWA
jgi:hypothetical protein